MLEMMLKQIGFDPEKLQIQFNEMQETVKQFAADLRTVREQNAEILSLLKQEKGIKDG